MRGVTHAGIPQVLLIAPLVSWTRFAGLEPIPIGQKQETGLKSVNSFDDSESLKSIEHQFFGR